MEAFRRSRSALVLLLCGLVLLSSAERRLAYLDFNADYSVRIENNDKPDGDEIIQRLLFVDDATEPIAPSVGEAYHPAVVSFELSARSLTVVRLSENRAPPFASPTHV